MTSKETYQLKSKILRIEYRPYYDKWQDCNADDRAIFKAIYDKLIEAYKEMENIENNSIRVAFNNYDEEKIKILDEIIEYFEGREGKKDENI